VNPEIAARLASFGIEWFASAQGYCFFTRDNCAAIAHQQATGFSLGSAGVMTEGGLAYLLWREGAPYLSAHGGNANAATPEQVAAVQSFSADLKAALA
jgi:hypothetical protein